MNSDHRLTRICELADEIPATSWTEDSVNMYHEFSTYIGEMSGCKKDRGRFLITLSLFRYERARTLLDILKGIQPIQEEAKLTIRDIEQKDKEGLNYLLITTYWGNPGEPVHDLYISIREKVIDYNHKIQSNKVDTGEKALNDFLFQGDTSQ